MVAGLCSEGCGPGQCFAPGRCRVSRVSPTPPNPAWRPEPPSLCPRIPRTLHPTLLGASPEPPGILAVVPLIRDQRYYGEDPASIRACRREWAAKAPHPNCENPMLEGYPKRQADNDLNHCPAASYGHWKIGNLSLFQVSRFGFRISAPGKASVLRYAPAAVGAATTARLGRAVLCGKGGDAGARHFLV